MLQQDVFVPCGTVAKYSYAFTLFDKPFDKPNCKRRFAGTSGQVAPDDDDACMERRLWSQEKFVVYLVRNPVEYGCCKSQ